MAHRTFISYFKSNHDLHQPVVPVIVSISIHLQFLNNTTRKYFEEEVYIEMDTIFRMSITRVYSLEHKVE